MYRKLITACMALAAFGAFVVMPSVASASPVLTHPAGTPVPVNTKIVGTLEPGTESIFTSSLGNINCTHATLTGTVASNTGSHIAGDISSAVWGGSEAETKCKSWAGAVKPTPTGLPWCITATGTKHTFTVRGGKCSEAAKPLSFTLDFPSFTCGYERTTPVNGTFTTGTPSTLKIADQGFARVHGGFLCPSEGRLDMGFYLYTDDGKHTEPMGIS
jgi:hypothetical protein